MINRYHLTVKQKTFLFRQLSYLIGNNYSIELALYKMQGGYRQRRKKSFVSHNWRKVIDKLMSEFQETGSLAYALSAVKIFEPSVVYQVESGEKSGELAEVLIEVSNSFEVNANITGSLKALAIYPVILCIALMVAINIVSTLVIPQTISSATELGAELPIVSKIVFKAIDFLTVYGIQIFSVSAALIALLIIGLQISKVRYFWDYMLVKNILTKGLVRKLDLVRYCQVFAAMFRTGVDQETTLNSAAKTIKNSYLRKQALHSARLVIEHGFEIPEALMDSGIFEETEIQLIDVGISTDNTHEVFANLAARASSELEAEVKMLMALIPSLSIAVLSIVIGIFVIGVSFPIYSIMDSLGGF